MTELSNFPGAPGKFPEKIEFALEISQDSAP
jgi:hypothetical protein